MVFVFLCVFGFCFVSVFLWFVRGLFVVCLCVVCSCVVCSWFLFVYCAVSDLAHDVRFDLPDVTVFDLHMTELTGLAVRPHIDEVRGEIHRTSQ